jgi:hypothetical protein
LLPGRDAGVIATSPDFFVNGLGTHELPEAVQKEKDEAVFGDSEISMPPEHSA